MKEDAKIAKKAKQMMMVRHGGATLAELVMEERATAEPVEPAITTASQQHHESPDEATPWVLIEHLM